MGKLKKEIVMTEEEKEKHAESLKIGETEVVYVNDHSIKVIKKIIVRLQWSLLTDVNVLLFYNLSFRYVSVHQKYKRLKRYVAHYEILWHRPTRVTL